MTVKELIVALSKCDSNRIVIISNVRAASFATYPIKEIVISESGPVYIRAKKEE